MSARSAAGPTSPRSAQLRGPLAGAKVSPGVHGVPGARGARPPGAAGLSGAVVISRIRGHRAGRLRNRRMVPAAWVVILAYNLPFRPPDSPHDEA